MINEILTLAAIITAITTIITIPINLYKKFRKKLDEEKEFKANVIKTLNEIKEKQEKTECDCSIYRWKEIPDREKHRPGNYCRQCCLHQR